MTSTLTRRVVTGAATLALLTGGAVAMAPTASAVGSSACTWTWQWPQKMEATTAVHLRSGPSSGYTSKGILYKGNDFKEYCNKGWTWSYGKVLSGANAGKWGWVYSDYLRFTV
jgi:uncharacterized protein YraI